MPRFASTPSLDRHLRPAEAARITVAAALARMDASAEAILSRDEPEDIHRFRVASRRLRAALRAFREVLDPSFEERVRADLAWITTKAGVVRDLDVLATTTFPALMRSGMDAPGDRVMRRLEMRREHANRELRRALGSRRHAALRSAFARWLEAPQERAGSRGEELRRFAAKSVKRRFRAVRAAAGEDAATLGPAARHRLRIAVKKLRYGMEVFASLWPRKAVRRVEHALSALQDSLGRANDAVAATRLCRSLEAPAAWSARLRGRLAGEIRACSLELAPQLAALDAARRDWKRAAR